MTSCREHPTAGMYSQPEHLLLQCRLDCVVESCRVQSNLVRHRKLLRSRSRSVESVGLSLTLFLCKALQHALLCSLNSSLKTRVFWNGWPGDRLGGGLGLGVLSSATRAMS